mgnify:CR=1 FL=1
MKYDFPKLDLHLHLDGSMLPESAWEMAKERNIKLPADNIEDFKKFIIVTADCRSVNDYLERFEMPLQIMQDSAAISRTAFSTRPSLPHPTGMASRCICATICRPSAMSS